VPQNKRYSWGNPLRVIPDVSLFLVTEFLGGSFSTGVVSKVDKLFEGVRWVTTKIFRFLSAVAEGCGLVLRVSGLMTLAFFHGCLEVIKAFGKFPVFFANAWRQR
jgi:hypothetical protein